MTSEFTPNQPSVDPIKAMIKYAFAWLLVDIVLLLIVYYLFPSIMGGIKEGILHIVVGVGLAVYFTLQIRKEIGGYWNYGTALKTTFLLFFIPAVLLYGFKLLFVQIEPQYEHAVTEATLNSTTGTMENFIEDQDQLDEMIEGIEKGVYTQFHPGLLDLLTLLGQMAIGYLIAAAIWALIFKKERPIFVDQEEDVV